jgi:hypothetical protein
VIVNCSKECSSNSQCVPPIPPEPQARKSGEKIPLRRLQMFAKKRFKRHEFLR